MRLTGVTITGVDERTDPDFLAAVAADHPFVEFGVLFSPSRQGREQRYPADPIGHVWRIAPRVRLAAHLCGQAARDVAAGDGRVLVGLRGIYRRVQLNGVQPTSELASRIFPAFPEIEFILQVSTLDDVDFADQYVTSGAWPNVSILFDPSGGRGVPVLDYLQRAPRLLPITRESRVGYAGGILPTTVRPVCVRLRQLAVSASITMGTRIDCSMRQTWIDMESGVRTDDWLDPKKVLAVLEAAAPFVVAA